MLEPTRREGLYAEAIEAQRIERECQEHVRLEKERQERRNAEAAAKEAAEAERREKAAKFNELKKVRSAASSGGAVRVLDFDRFFFLIEYVW